MDTHTCYVSLGSNLGDRATVLQRAFCELNSIHQTHIRAWSRIYETEPVDWLEQPAFLNAVVKLSSSLSPKQLLDAFLCIENRLGRVRTVRYGPRIIDVDLLFYDDLVLSEESLQLPHPRLHERAFVLVPMMEIASHVFHPRLRETISQLYERVHGKEGVTLCLSYLQSDCAPTES